MKSSSNKKSKLDIDNKNIRIMVKCAWSGARLIPSSSCPTGGVCATGTDNNKTGYNQKTTLAEIVSHLSHSLPSIITETNVYNEHSKSTCNENEKQKQPFLVYMRTSIYKCDWDNTTIGDLFSNTNHVTNKNANRRGTGIGTASSSTNSGMDSIMFTLNLPKDYNQNHNDVKTETIHDTNPNEIIDPMDPMDIDKDNNNVATTTNSSIASTTASASASATSTINTQQAIQNILSSNFDKTSITFFQTILKIINNILSTSTLSSQQFYQYNTTTLSSTSMNNSIVGKSLKVRMLKFNNKFVQKHILQTKYGLEFILYIIGFSYQSTKTTMATMTTTSSSSSTTTTTTAFDFDGSYNTNYTTNSNEIIELKPEEEDKVKLQSIYKSIVHVLTHDLNVLEQDIPVMQQLSTLSVVHQQQQQQQGQQEQVSSASTATSFDPYKSHSYNVQTSTTKANTTTQKSNNNLLTATERQIEMLKQKEKELQQSIQSKFVTHEQRNIIATLPSSTLQDQQQPNSIVTLTSSSATNTTSTYDESKNNDYSLLASQIKKLQNTNNSNYNNNATFQTKAMREMEKLKSKKVYTHVLLKVYFSDGLRLDIQFLPNESILDVKNIICNCLIDDCFDDSGGNSGSDGDVVMSSSSSTTLVRSVSTLRPELQFELYISPPKRILKDDLTLDQEGLVPAAKVFVSWKNGNDTLNRLSLTNKRNNDIGWYIQHQYFQSGKNVFGSLVSNNVIESSSSSSFPTSKLIIGDDDNNNNNNSDDEKKNQSRSNDHSNNNGKMSLKEREEMLMKKMMGGKKKKDFGNFLFKGKGNILGGGGDDIGKNDRKSGGDKSSNNNNEGSSNKPKWFKG